MAGYMDFLSQIDFCIKAYRRPKALARLLASIERFYPGAHVTVNQHPEIHTGRNQMVDATERPYLLFLDDDFEFDDDSFPCNSEYIPLCHVGQLWAQLMALPAAGIVAGGVIDCDGEELTLRNSGGNFRLEHGVLYLDACQKFDANYRGYVDVAPNFFIARREVFQPCRWRFGLGAEHADFFLQVWQAGWKVYQYRRFTILHHIADPESLAAPYREARWNTGEPIARFMDHWGIDRIVVNGKVVHSRPCYA